MHGSFDLNPKICDYIFKVACAMRVANTVIVNKYKYNINSAFFAGCIVYNLDLWRGAGVICISDYLTPRNA